MLTVNPEKVKTEKRSLDSITKVYLCLVKVNLKENQILFQRGRAENFCCCYYRLWSYRECYTVREKIREIYVIE